MSATAADYQTLRALLVERHRDDLWRYLRALGAGPDLADDLTQDSFVLAFEKGIEDRGRGATGAYLRRFARHLWLRSRRTKARRREQAVAEEIDWLWREEVGDDSAAFLAALGTCLESLDGRARRAVTLRYREGLDRAAMAAVLGLEENGVKTLLQRIRRLLRDCVLRRLA